MKLRLSFTLIYNTSFSQIVNSKNAFYSRVELRLEVIYSLFVKELICEALMLTESDGVDELAHVEIACIHGGVFHNAAS